MEIQLFVVLFLYKYEFVLLDAVPKEVRDAFPIVTPFIHQAQLNNHAQLWLHKFWEDCYKTCNKQLDLCFNSENPELFQQFQLVGLHCLYNKVLTRMFCLIVA